ncbi:hypothetical protein [Allokutzneria oryzae]|uniref:Uncharacterized protein n=1 Tax=Allokutzneria oryzae TaxID=1378989 RepID=A0ABV5ZUB1_9PSEU
MRRWWAALGVAVVTTGVGIAVNVATDLGSNVWAWVAVAVLTLAAAGVAVWTTQTTPAAQAAPAADKQAPQVRNSISGNVTGSVVQAGHIEGDVRLGERHEPQD